MAQNGFTNGKLLNYQASYDTI